MALENHSRDHGSSDERSHIVNPAHIPLPPDQSDDEAPNEPKVKSKHSKKPKTKRWNKKRKDKKKDDTESHWFHQDSGGVITVRSEDNIKFEISKDKLGGVSKTFGVIFNETCYHPSSSEPVYLPYPADTLALFFDLISVSNPTPIIKSLDMDRTQYLLNFIKFADCGDLESQVRRHLLKISKNQSMSLLSFASSTNDIGLAKIALRRLNKDSIYSGIPDNLSGYRAFISNLQPAFQAEILSLIMVNTKSDACADHQGKPTNNIDWKWVAENFNPDGRSEFSDEDYVSTDEELRQEEPQEYFRLQARGSNDWTADPAQDASGGW